MHNFVNLKTRLLIHIWIHIWVVEHTEQRICTIYFFINYKLNTKSRGLSSQVRHRSQNKTHFVDAHFEGPNFEATSLIPEAPNPNHGLCHESATSSQVQQYVQSPETASCTACPERVRLPNICA